MRLRHVSYDIVFQEVPGEVALAVNISGCPHRCAGCHSPHLREDTGETLDEDAVSGLLEQYGAAVTCVCFMGGDAAPQEVCRLADHVKRITDGRIRTAWYSGRSVLPEGCSPDRFDYIKLGPYVRELGGLDSPTTNQRFYRITNGQMEDITARFRGNCKTSY